MCNKAVNNYSHALEVVPECNKTQKIRDKSVDTHPPRTKFLPEFYNTLFIDNIWGADVADMQLISKFSKGFRFSLCVIDIMANMHGLCL